MQMKMVCDDRTLREVANEFSCPEKAQNIQERTLNNYKNTYHRIQEKTMLFSDFIYVVNSIIEIC